MLLHASIAKAKATARRRKGIVGALKISAA
jgi:hypothetical protein